MKRVFGWVELVFDGCYLCMALLIGGLLVIRGNTAFGIMAIVLAGGDAFHLVPRMFLIWSGQEERLQSALGRGKQITSITMTIFYLILWWSGGQLFSADSGIIWDMLIGMLAAVRILLCLLPQNGWTDRYPPVRWGIVRNIPFFLMGMAVAVRFFLNRGAVPAVQWMWLAVLLSFAFYLPVVLYAYRCPKLGMLMLPKTCMYLWILLMCTAV